MEPKLAVLLCQVCQYQQRIEMARQIVGQDMNFSPAWIITLILNPENSQRLISITEFAHFMEYLKTNFSPEQITLIFDYFDAKKQGKIQSKYFVEGFLPFQKTSLRKAISKRLAEDIQMTTKLKYALKRLFLQILSYQKQVTSFEGYFDHGKFKDIQKYDDITPKQIQQFIKLHGKYLSENQISMVMNNIKLGRIKAIKQKYINQIIKQTLNLPFANFPNQAKINDTWSKQNILSTNKQKNPSLLHQLDHEPMNETRVNNVKNSRRQITQTPIQRIKQYPQGIHFPKSHTLAKKNSNMSELSLLQSINDEMNGKINSYRLQNDQKKNYVLDQLTDLKGR